MKRDLNLLEEKIGYKFRDKSLLKNALIHRSYGNENWKYKHINNERLELLGDAVLDLVVAEYLYINLASSPEGELARLKSMIVSEPVLSRVSKELGIGEYLLLSKGEEITGGRVRSSILGDVFEAVLGAIYLDSDYVSLREIVLKHLKQWIDNIESDEEILDYKTILQEHMQKEYKCTPVYILSKEEGPDHNKTFEIIVKIGDDKIGVGVGKNKKNAEQLAAKNLLKKIEVLNNETL